MKINTKNALVGVSLFFIISLSVVVSIEYKYSTYLPKNFYTSTNKVWAHRGGVGENYEPYSIQKFIEAENNGAAGIEIDIYFDSGIKDFIVSPELRHLAVSHIAQPVIFLEES